SPSSSRTSPTMTRAPSAVNSRASAAPWPRAPPVMIATLPSSRRTGARYASTPGSRLSSCRGPVRVPPEQPAEVDVVAPDLAQPPVRDVLERRLCGVEQPDAAGRQLLVRVDRRRVEASGLRVDESRQRVRGGLSVVARAIDVVIVPAHVDAGPQALDER